MFCQNNLCLIFLKLTISSVVIEIGKVSPKTLVCVAPIVPPLDIHWETLNL